MSEMRAAPALGAACIVGEKTAAEADLARCGARIDALTAALARHHWGVGPGLAQHVTCPVCGLDARLQPREGA